MICSVYMGGHPVTDMVQELRVRQSAHCIYREFDLTFHNWVAVDLAARWDIFASYDAALPHAMCPIRQGVVPPDRPPEFGAGGGPMRVRVQGYDEVWLMQRRGPRRALVMVGDRSEVAEAVAGVGSGGLGRFVVYSGLGTLHTTIRQLCHLAGFNAELRIPDMELRPQVVMPSTSYWTAAKSLSDCVAAELFYNRTTNTVIFADPLEWEVTGDTVMTIPTDTIVEMVAVAQPYRTPAGLVVQFPRVA